MSVVRPRQRAGGAGPLALLLGAERFRLGRDAGRIASNFALHGGHADEAAAAWIGADLPPHGAPSITLGAARGTLGPFSFGFLDNTRADGAAALATPLPARPRRGSIALVCGRRDALPDIAPLVVARALGVSWIISVGDGDPDEALAFAGNDPSTRAIVLTATEAARPGCLARANGKPVIVLGGDALLRAAARRAGGADTGDLESALAHAALLGSGVARFENPVALVVGGGHALLAQAAKAAGIALPITTVSDDDPAAVEEAIAAVAREGDLLLVAASEPIAGAPDSSIAIDLGHLDRVRALLGAIVARRRPVPVLAPATQTGADRDHAVAIVEAGGTGGALGDHDAKRLLKAYGVRVSRQAPASSPTAALRIGAQIGFPVEVIASHPQTNAGANERRATSPAELKRTSALFLDGAPFVLVREAFPSAPRARLHVRHEKGLGAYLVVEGAEPVKALLPLDATDVSPLVDAAGFSDDASGAELITRIATAALERNMSFDLELWTGDDPAVVSASARRR